MYRLNIATSIQCRTASRVSKSLSLPVFETRPLFIVCSYTKIFLMTTGETFPAIFGANKKILF